VLDVQLRFMLEISVPEGHERVITGAYRTDDDEVVLTGHTVVSDAYHTNSSTFSPKCRQTSEAGSATC
jgi:hypothetical protein